MGGLILTLITLLSFLSLAYFLGEKKKFPYSILILIFGLITGLIFNYLNLESLHYFEINHDVIFFVFLPVLIFEGIININIKHLKFNIKSILSFASFGLILSTIIIGFLLHWILGIELILSLLFASLISATDPVSVVGIFKTLGVPKRLTTIIEGESLLNDATAVILFQILLGYYLTQNVSFSGIIGDFTWMVIFAIILGGIMGHLFSYISEKLKDNVNLVIITSFILAEITFVVGEHLLHMSGILSTVIAGIVYKIKTDNILNSSVKNNRHIFWDLLGFLGNSFLFFLLGFYAVFTNVEKTLGTALIALIVVLIGRALSVYITAYFLNKNDNKDTQIPLSWQHIINIGGLRGAIAVAMVLHLSHHLSDNEFANTLIGLVFFIVLFTSIFNTFIIKWMIRKLNLDNLNIDDDLDILENKILIKEQIIKDSFFKENSIINRIGNKYKEELKGLNNEISTRVSLHKNNVIERETFIIQCLSLENKLYKDYYNNGLINEFSYIKLFNGIEKQIENIEYHKQILLTEIEKISNNNIVNNLDSIYLKITKKYFKEYFIKRNIEILKGTYEFNKAKEKATYKVINFIKKCNNIHPKKDISLILKQYKEINKGAKINIQSLNNFYKNEIKVIEEIMAINILYRKELEELTNLQQKGIIKDKVFSILEKDIYVEKENNNNKLYINLKNSNFIKKQMSQ